MTSWGKRDLIEHYGLPEEKVQRRPLGLGALGVPGADRRATSQALRRAARPCRRSSSSIPRRPGPTRTTRGCSRRSALIRDREGLSDPAGLPRQAEPPLRADRGARQRAGPGGDRAVSRVRQPARASRALRARDGAGLPEPVRGLGAAGLRGVLGGPAGGVVIGDQPAGPGRRRRAALRPGRSGADREQRAAALARPGAAADPGRAGQGARRAVQLRPHGAPVSCPLPPPRWAVALRGRPYPSGRPAPGLSGPPIRP